MNKNWNDRADKDLFFTILSVKNIGVISGGEWTTIGNHMRSLGYGFTNEGCRQHFQGLRRAQQKAESNGAVADSPRKADPTMNPITRRPGPGRGRPRKQPPVPVAQPGQDPAMSVQPQDLSSEPLDDEEEDEDITAPVSASLSVPIPPSDPANLGLVPDEPEDEEQPAKRQRLDDDAPDPIDDAAVLALDADGNPDALVHHDLPE
ncbi:hypothetical protein BX600DRAFT_141791 [Xylariales sp. PMI_506]|nr:hypothetical protein BX600DRAFT_141791 [Xylariales sp. PMI_506]